MPSDLDTQQKWKFRPSKRKLIIAARRLFYGVLHLWRSFSYISLGFVLLRYVCTYISEWFISPRRVSLGVTLFCIWLGDDIWSPWLNEIHIVFFGALSLFEWSSLCNCQILTWYQSGVERRHFQKLGIHFFECFPPQIILKGA